MPLGPKLAYFIGSLLCLQRGLLTSHGYANSRLRCGIQDQSERQQVTRRFETGLQPASLDS